MNLNRLAPFRVVNTWQMSWVRDGRLVIIRQHFSPGLVSRETTEGA